MNNQLHTRIDGESFSHRTLWRCASKMYALARKQPKGAKYPDMACCLMAYLAYEAYLNLLLDRLDPETWSNERRFFSQGEFRGIEGKVRWIAKLCGDFEIDKGSRPYQTIQNLGNLRDGMVHAKPVTYSETTVHHEDAEPDWWPREPYPEIDPDYVRVALEDVEAFMEYVHDKVKDRLRDPMLKAGALTGPTAYATTSSKPAT